MIVVRFLCSLSLMLMLALPSFAQLQRPISGVVAASSGKVEVRYMAPDGAEIGRVAGVGDPIYLDDEIITGPDTSLQILLKDQTVFTIGPNAILVFDEFIYDPTGAEESSLTASVQKGAFKFISGKISKKSPEAMRLKLPNATASVRGTTVAGRVSEEGDADVILLSGAISVTSDINPAPIDIFQPGWGTSISAVGAVSDPFQLTAEALDSILAEASVEAPAEQQDQAAEAATDGEGEQTEDGATTTTALLQTDLTPEQAVIAEFTQTVATELAANGETEVAIGDLFNLILANSDLVAQLEAQGLDVTDAPTDINYAYLDTQLVSMLASGASPEYMKLLSDGSGGYYLNHSDIDPTLAQMVSESYSGSVTFTGSGLNFAARGSSTSASGTASFDYTIFYDTARATGSFAINGLQINGANYGDASQSFTNISLYNRSQVDFVDDGIDDFQVDVGDEIFEVELATVTFNEGGNEAFAQLNSSLGSITDGTDVVDGILGSTNIMVNDTSDGELRARVEKHGVGRKN